DGLGGLDRRALRREPRRSRFGDGERGRKVEGLALRSSRDGQRERRDDEEETHEHLRNDRTPAARTRGRCCAEANQMRRTVKRMSGGPVEARERIAARGASVRAGAMK